MRWKTPKATPPDLIGDEYAVVSLRIGWGAASILFFGLALAARYLLDFQPWRPQRYWLWPMMRPGFIAALSALGLGSGLVGLKLSANKSLAKMGVLLNGIVLGIIALVALGMAIVFYAR